MNIEDPFNFVAPKVRDAAIKTAAQLQQLGIRHALAGGLAVGDHGYIRATIDVNFLVGEEAFEHHGGLVTFKPGVPIEVDDIRIDYLSPLALGAQLEETLTTPLVSKGIPIVPVEVLIYLKLVAKRRKDMVDVVELLRVGADAKKVRHYLQQYADDLLPLFAELLDESQAPF